MDSRTARVLGNVIAGVCLAAMVCGSPRDASADQAAAVPVDDGRPPNILLIVAEDMSPRIGAFGDPLARTPTLDQLAADGVRFTNVFSVSGVCAPNRSSLITGVHAISMGTLHQRTDMGVPGTDVDYYEAVPPPEVKAFPELLRAAGYATANFAKRDYQFGEPFTIWDIDAGNATSPLEPALWRNLPEDKPFFIMLNLMATHESRLALPRDDYPESFRDSMNERAEATRELVDTVTDPDRVIVPPYYPETEGVRDSVAKHYDNVHYMDRQVGRVLAELDADGLDENTIVIFLTDNGDPFPRAKRSVYDSGLRVPMIVRFPDGGEAGKVDDGLVSIVDIAPSILALADVTIPAFIQGRSFLDREQRTYVHAAMDRMDAVPDRVRAVSDGRYKYLRNYRPEVPFIRPLTFRDLFPIMREWLAAHANGMLSPVERRYFEVPRPSEELYDTSSDPWEIENLAEDPEFEDALERLRAALDGWIDSVGDLGAIAEIDLVERMWPGRQQPETAPPVSTVEVQSETERRVSLSSATDGASIGYRIGNGAWQLYTTPFVVDQNLPVEAKAIRYGYAESSVSIIPPLL